MAQTTDIIPLNITLIGPTGDGKSATGNSILGRKAFKTSSSSISETKFVTAAWAQHGPYEIQVLDGPGMGDTRLDAIQDKKQLFENATKALAMCGQGMCVFVLVVSFWKRYFGEHITNILELKQIFGENYLNSHGIIVVTGGDCFSRYMEEEGTPGKPFKQWCREQDKFLGHLIEECNDRVVLFNNRSHCPEEQTRQRNELLFYASQLQKEFSSTPACRMAQTADRISLHLLLIGKTGHGKSATGNSILGRKAFKRAANVKSETKEVAYAWAEHEPYEIKVIDGPGLGDTDLDAVEDKEHACENMFKALMMCNGGIHAFVLVMRFGDRYTEEERNTISNLKKIFGDNYLKHHGIIVMTRGDGFLGQMEADDTPGKTFKQWCDEQVEEFGDLIEECSPRVVLFNNISKSEEENTKQRNELLFHAGQLQKEKGLYTTEHFLACAQIGSEYTKKSKQKILEETIQKRISLLLGELELLPVHPSPVNIATLDARIADVYVAIGKESLQEASLQPLIGCLKRLQSTTEQLRRAVWKNNLTAMEANSAVMSQHYDELCKMWKMSWVSIVASILLSGLLPFTAPIHFRHLYLIRCIRKMGVWYNNLSKK